MVLYPSARVHIPETAKTVLQSPEILQNQNLQNAWDWVATKWSDHWPEDWDFQKIRETIKLWFFRHLTDTEKNFHCMSFLLP